MTTSAPTADPLPVAKTGRGSLWSRLVRGQSLIHSEPAWDEIAGPGWPARIMSETVADRFHAKQGRSIGRWTLTRDGRTIVVYLKRHYDLSRRHGLLAVLFPSRGWSPGLAEWEHLAWARANDFPVPRAMAAGELRGPWGRLQSFLAVEELADMLPLHEAIPLAQRQLTSAAFSGWKRGLVGELARLSRELHRRRMFHQDLYLCHFYVSQADCNTVPETWKDRIAMIDFHRLARHRIGWAWWQAKDLGQLLYSTFDVAGISNRDRVRFWKLYREGDWRTATPPPGWVKAVARFRATRYFRKNAARDSRTSG